MAAAAAPKSSKEIAVELKELYPNLRVQTQDNHIMSLHTKIRDKTCSRNDFVFYSNRLLRLLLEEALGMLEYREKVCPTFATRALSIFISSKSFPLSQ